jgi:3-hydroxyacyl-CoA dehydrogenase
MGAQIAQALAMAGYKVQAFDRDEAALGAGRSAVEQKSSAAFCEERQTDQGGS